jgi:hypothetical protein
VLSASSSSFNFRSHFFFSFLKSDYVLIKKQGLDYNHSKPISTRRSEPHLVTHHHSTLYDLIDADHEQPYYMIYEP